jgi:transposase
LERRRRLAVCRVGEGYAPAEVAEFLAVDPRSVRRWVAAARRGGRRALRPRTGAGRPPKLDHTQTKIVDRWLARPPLDLGFETDLWTAGRLAALIRETWDVRFNRRYLAAWLRARGYTPQKPQRVPRERDEQAIAAWRAETWPRVQKKRAAAGACCSSTRAGS